MGITQVSFDLLSRTLTHQDIPLDGLLMVELGNQFLYLNDPMRQEYPHLTPAKGYFEKQGVTHVSLDMNGQDGALPLDLSHSLELQDLSLNMTADIVTNYGTIEHVANSLWQALENVHRFCGLDCLMIHTWPMHGNWPKHGHHYVSTKTFEALASIAGYEILTLECYAAMSNTTDGWEVHCHMRKKEDKPFPDQKKFKQIVPIWKE